jgi:hypothetical protein
VSGQVVSHAVAVRLAYRIYPHSTVFIVRSGAWVLVDEAAEPFGDISVGLTVVCCWSSSHQATLVKVSQPCTSTDFGAARTAPAPHRGRLCGVRRCGGRSAVAARSALGAVAARWEKPEEHDEVLSEGHPRHRLARPRPTRAGCRRYCLCVLDEQRPLTPRPGLWHWVLDIDRGRGGHAAWVSSS